MWYNYCKKMFIRRAKPIRITSFRISGVLLYLLFMLSFDIANCETLWAIRKDAPQTTERQCGWVIFQKDRYDLWYYTRVRFLPFVTLPPQLRDVVDVRTSDFLHLLTSVKYMNISIIRMRCLTETLGSMVWIYLISVSFSTRNTSCDVSTAVGSWM
jgi:hypothetical protein